MQLNSRDSELLMWLVHMKFMTLDQIGRVFFEDCNPKRACYRRILKLMKAGYIAKKKVYTEARDIYIPTQKSFLLLRSQGSKYALKISRDRAFANFGHDKALTDIRVLFYELGVETWFPERVIRSFRPRGSVPDAFLMTQKALYAIEYERTEKRLARYKSIFSQYDDSDKFDAVLYICRSESFISRVRKKHDPTNRFFFITFEALMKDRKDAVFFSGSDGLPVKQLIRESTKTDLKEIDPAWFEDFFVPKDKNKWKPSKPYISIPKPHNSDEDHDDFLDPYSSGGEEEVDANMSPIDGQGDDDSND